ncbi:MAG: hypothetical protein ACLSVD_00450 [Eggerthellaceae bacterium]
MALVPGRRRNVRQLPHPRTLRSLADRHPRLHAAPRHRHGVRAARIPERGLVRVHFGRGVHAVSAAAGEKHLGILQRRRGLARARARRRAREGRVHRGAARDVARVPEREYDGQFERVRDAFALAERRRRLPELRALLAGLWPRPG